MNLVDGASDMLLEFRDSLDAEFEELNGTEALVELRRNRWDASASRSDATDVDKPSI
jgi:hypothetical protein